MRRVAVGRGGRGEGGEEENKNETVGMREISCST